MWPGHRYSTVHPSKNIGNLFYFPILILQSQKWKWVFLKSLLSNILCKRWNNLFLPYDSFFNIHSLHGKVVIGA